MVILLMGVSGSGKTTVGRRLAADQGWAFHDADDLHPPENIDRMSRGLPLTDEHRKPWLFRLRDLIIDQLGRDEPAVIACSALKDSYRRILRCDGRVRIVYLKGSYELIEQRMEARAGHYFKAGLLASQFADLEEPDAALVVDVSLSPEEIVETIRSGLAMG